MEKAKCTDKVPEESASDTAEQGERGWSEDILRFLKEAKYSPDDFIIDRSDLLPLSDKGIFDDEDE